jgi:hypothetical protein
MKNDTNEYTDTENSFLYYADRAGNLHFIDTEPLVHFENYSPLLGLVSFINSEGYCGIDIDEVTMPNGTCLQSLNVNMATPEGRLFAELHNRTLLGGRLPKYRKILKKIEAEHKKLRLEM